MPITRILGIVAIVIGAVLLFIGFDSSDAPMDQISNTVTGRYTDETMTYIIVGIIAVVSGGLVAIFGRR